MHILFGHARKLEHCGYFASSSSRELAEEKTRPTLPLKYWSPPPELIKSENPDLPIVPVSFGQLLCTGNNIDVQRNSMDVGVDFPGTAFFMLTGSRRRVRQNWISMIRFAQRNRWRSEQTLLNGQ